MPRGLSSEEKPELLGGGDDMGGHDGLEGTMSGLMGGDVGCGRGTACEGGVELEDEEPPTRKRRTPFISLCERGLCVLAGI